ncbi:hypothetical protein [uncultured Roseibium sp.]|uniref:hypothetical protein n=1 Tax=uncultured Roseibium sp. TaxID=1936171 RepID=UPI002605F54D|nr:hypothetical protein [uncultured Roseibium sp.]
MANPATAASGASGGTIPGAEAFDSVQNTMNRTANTLREGESNRLKADINTIGKVNAHFDEAMSKNIDRQIDNLR